MNQNKMWTYGVNNNRQILICFPKANDTQTCLTWNSYPCVANNSTWHTSIFDMKQLSMCGKQQQMTHKNFWHETVIHMWQTTANDTQAFLTWNSYSCGKQQQMTYKHVWHETVIHVANKSKWHTSSFDMKQLSICGKQQQMTHKHFWHETVAQMWQQQQKTYKHVLTWNSYPYVANNSKWHTRMFDMSHLSICGKQQQMAYKHVWHETVIHMWQTTANDTQACLTWNNYPYVANNSQWHTSIFDVKEWSMCCNQQQMTHKHVWHETVIHVANSSKWHASFCDMKQLSICGKQQQMTQKHFWHETVVHMWQTTANDIQACLTWNSYPCGK